ncbi:MAG TPA: ArsB/NhaD family transporter [Thermotogota bacterium]|nr:ArsB/NhaD family transporter [Thermotogota bacterium]HRW33887.1 ArsB/NhaD family transporter [Thermotogota bacterium]
MQTIIVLFLFLLTYYLIISGKFQRSLVAFTIALVIMLLKICEGITVKEVSDYVDFNTIGILLGMMILVGILKKTGLFQYIAAKIVKSSKGKMYLIYITLLVAVAFFSSVLDNVTTILLFSPVVFLIADTAGISPVSLIFSMIFAANIGGMTTIVGDPPNILVGSASGTSFIDFMLVMIWPSVVMLLCTIVYFHFRYPHIRKIEQSKLKRLMDIDPKKAIEDRPLFLKGIVIFALVILGFVVHETLDYEASLIALTGAAILMLLSKIDFQEISSEVEWDTIFFFIGLFTLAKALEDVGIIGSVANWINQFSSNPLLLILAILWISAALGGFIGAVPVVTVFIPIVDRLQGMIPHSAELWWALALGACIGGNLTLSGAAANMVAVGLIEKTQRTKISFLSFLKEGVVITVIGLVIATLYLVFRWYMI